MWKKTAIFSTVFLVVVNAYAWAQIQDKPNSTGPAGSTEVVGTKVELARHQNEASSVSLLPARMGDKPGMVVVFEGTEDLHYYASEDTAPAGYRLKVEAESDAFKFGEVIFPRWGTFFDKAMNKEIEVYGGNFTVFVPIAAVTAKEDADTKIEQADVEVKVTGIACTSMLCLPPFEKKLRTTINWTQRDSWKPISFETASDASPAGPSYSAFFALTLALLAGLSLNIMPCVWPVLPLIIMRIVEQAKQGKKQSAALGLAFCLGILLFFACLAGANIILQLVYGTVLQWGDQFRNPAFVAGMALLLVVLALFMFGLFTITVPSSIAGKSGSGKGFSGAIGMGFLAAVLSTPCSFGILAAAFAWAQTQSLPLGTFAIMLIGVGMAVPYAILTSMPGLLNRLPASGRWMELVKQAVGFILLGIAVWLIAALPDVRRMRVIYFAIVLGFCVWMWGGWVTYSTRSTRKWIIRILAVILVVAAGWKFLPAPPGELIDWQPYDPALIEKTLEEKKPVLIKFTANWCLSCKVVDKMVYARQDVADIIEQKEVLAVKADTTEKKHPATLALKNKYKEPGVPVSILFLPGREQPVRWYDKSFAGELKKLLEKLPSKQ